MELAHLLSPDLSPPKKSGLALPVGTKTRSRSGSAAMIDHAFAAPVFHTFACSAEFFGIGSQLHRRLPVRTSKARTTPLGMSTFELSLMAEPTTTTSPMTVGG